MRKQILFECFFNDLRRGEQELLYSGMCLTGKLSIARDVCEVEMERGVRDFLGWNGLMLCLDLLVYVAGDIPKVQELLEFCGVSIVFGRDHTAMFERREIHAWLMKGSQNENEARENLIFGMFGYFFFNMQEAIKEFNRKCAECRRYPVLQKDKKGIHIQSGDARKDLFKIDLMALLGLDEPCFLSRALTKNLADLFGDNYQDIYSLNTVVEKMVLLFTNPVIKSGLSKYRTGFFIASYNKFKKYLLMDSIVGITQWSILSVSIKLGVGISSHLDELGFAATNDADVDSLKKLVLDYLVSISKDYFGQYQGPVAVKCLACLIGRFENMLAPEITRPRAKEHLSTLCMAAKSFS